MLENRIQNEADKLISFIKRFWDDKVSNIKITDIADKPFDIFTLAMKLYKKFDIMMEYERSTLAISVKIDDEFGIKFSVPEVWAIYLLIRTHLCCIPV